MKKLPLIILSIALFPALARAQRNDRFDPPPPPPADAQDVETARPPSAEPSQMPPAPPATPPARAQAQESNDDGVGILQSPGDGVGILQQGEASAPQAYAPRTASGQWVYTNQYGWVWMPYGTQYVEEGHYGDDSPYEYVYTVQL